MIGERSTNGRFVLTAGEHGPPVLVGGKAHGLQQLAELGLAVPRWATVTTDAMAAVLAGVQERIEEIARAVPVGDTAAAQRASPAIARLVEGAPWPPALTRELEEQLGVLGADQRLAVRSSAVGEDGTAHSFAGQLTTELNLGRHDVAAALRRCWAGAFSASAILYRQALGLAAGPVRVAVVIQEMVDARVSGVAFTADPLTGAPALAVAAAFGLGLGVVSDTADSDTYVRELGSEQWRVTARRKAHQIVPRSNGAPGVERAGVPLGRRDAPTLSEAQLDALAAVLRRIDASAGRPQDVEWAFDGNGTLWILQARPITLKQAAELAIWDDSNIGESYPGLTLPLTCSYVRFAYERLFGRALQLAGVPRRQVDRARPFLAHLVGVIRGRLYFNLVNYYRLFLLVPGLAGTSRKWETALGITQHVDPATLDKSRGRPRIGDRILAVRTAVCLARRLWRLRRDVRRFHERAAEMLRRYGDAEFSGRPAEELWRVFEEITKEFLDDWVLLIYNDFFAFLFDSRLAQVCNAVGGEPGPQGSGTDLHQRLLTGLVSLQSLAPLHSVLALVAAARAEPDVLALLQSALPAEAVWAELARCAGAAKFRTQAVEHLRLHGQRTIQELKLETPSLAATPSVLVSMVRNHLDHVAPAAGRPRSEPAAAARELEERLRGHPLRRRYASWLVRRTRAAIADREGMSYARARAYGVLRRLFQAMGAALARADVLRQPEDVFYLTLEDLESHVRDGSPVPEPGELVARRKTHYEAFARETLPHRIVSRGPVSEHRLARDDSAAPGANGVLRGLPCAPGRARGTARVLHAASPGERVEGTILVAPVTDPGWVFLMLTARGLVVERGSILSHTAILGRELGIPTVVGVEGATRLIASGDEIEVDGSTGEVVLLGRTEGGAR